MSRSIAVVALVSALAAPVLPASAGDEVPDISLEGLELVEKDRRGEIYANPDVDWTVFSEILLEPATVAFRKNWQRDQNRSQAFKVRTEDMERIKSELSELFGEVFTAELTGNGGYRMAQSAGETVLRITPHIVDLDVYAPDTHAAGIQRSYTESAGRMTLKLELYDSVTGDLLATARDRREAPRRGYLQWTNSVTNQMEARRMLERWAGELRERLDSARGVGDTAD